MNITNMADVINIDDYEKNGEWEIYKTTAIRDVRQNTAQGSRSLHPTHDISICAAWFTLYSHKRKLE